MMADIWDYRGGLYDRMTNALIRTAAVGDFKTGGRCRWALCDQCDVNRIAVNFYIAEKIVMNIERLGTFDLCNARAVRQ